MNLSKRIPKEITSTKRICTSKPLDHSMARKVLKQLKTNPEVCEKCKIKPCKLVMYVFGAKDQ